MSALAGPDIVEVLRAVQRASRASRRELYSAALTATAMLASALYRDDPDRASALARDMSRFEQEVDTSIEADQRDPHRTSPIPNEG
jgi:hypothetical protein